MTIQRAEEAVRELLSESDIIVGGHRPWDIRVSNPEFYARALEGGSLEVGESYMDGWWECDRLDQMFHRAYIADMHARLTRGLRGKLETLRVRFSHSRERDDRVPQAPPTRDLLGNDLFQAMLGPRMAYTCAYWSDSATLDEAQEAQFELVCRKLELSPGMTILEHGCGWGAFAKYAAAKHGVGVLGVCASAEQAELGRQLCRGLPVELVVQDYKGIEGRFDRVMSLGIIERLSPRDYRAYMENAARCLKDDGIGFIHTAGRNATGQAGDPWLDKHIRPGGGVPSLMELSAAMEGLFVMEDCHNIGPQFDPTLLAWHGNLEREWPALREKYGERLHRAMKYYLLSSAGSFRSRRGQVFQIVMTKAGRRQPHCRVDVGPWLELRHLIHK
jgi:cyclopropane-fatty-acyl-phospholipid synthase